MRADHDLDRADSRASGATGGRRRVWASLAAGVVLLGVGAVAATLLGRTHEPDAGYERLARQFADLEARLPNSPRSQLAAFERELGRQKAEIERRSALAAPNERERFAALLERFKTSVFLVYQEATIRVPGLERPIRLGDSGTGWIADASGLLVTNKHVVQPWKMEAELQALIDAQPGTRIETVLHAWPSGTRYVDGEGRLVPGVGYNSNEGGTLRLVALAADEWESADVETRGGVVHTRVHSNTDADLAVLSLAGGPFVPFPLKTDPETLRPLDPVMLLGFPLGQRVLEQGHADVSASLGTVRFVRDTVSHTASAFPGNSGGPLLALDGEVVGVLTRAPVVPGGGAAETFSNAIRSDVVHRLIAYARCARASPVEGGAVAFVRPERGIGVSTETLGAVVEVTVRPGALVRAGDVLLRIDDGLATMEEAQARAALDAANAQLARLGARSETNEKEVTAAEVARNLADASLTYARQQVRRASVRAPVDGVVADVALDAGTLVRVGTLALHLVRAQDAQDRKSDDAVAPGRTVCLFAEPSAGWRFVGWSDGVEAPARVVDVGSGPALEARFVPAP